MFIYNSRTVHNGRRGHTITSSLVESNDKRRGVPVCDVCACGDAGEVEWLIDKQVYAVRI